ncbi:unnamed protein product [Auanema sp. JU1783]|nr:unnamed protein product [Auanema sp. JU1783]
MNEIIRYGDITLHPAFNCSAMNRNPVGHKRPIWGILSIIYSIFAVILYVLCLLVIKRKENFKHSCYKIMFILGISDLSCVIIMNFIIGIYMILGTIFCDMPNIYFGIACIHMASWISYCYFCVFLVINRLLDIVHPKNGILIEIFAEKRLPIFVVIGILYGFYFSFFTWPVLYTDELITLITNPKIFTDKDDLYHNKLLDFNDFLVCFISCFLYIIYCVCVSNRYSNVQQLKTSHKRIQIQILAQASLICVLNCFSAVTYSLFLYIEVPHSIYPILFGIVQVGTAFPAFIYLILNKTIRDGVKSYLMRLCLAH